MHRGLLWASSITVMSPGKRSSRQARTNDPNATDGYFRSFAWRMGCQSKQNMMVVEDEEWLA
jgi:hypothetical protein